MSGFVQIDRDWLDAPWANKPNTVALYLRLMSEAVYEPRLYNGMTLAQGQVVIGWESEAQKAGISVQAFRTALSNLKTTNYVTTQSTNRCTIVTLLKYRKTEHAREKGNEQNNARSNGRSTTNQERRNQETHGYTPYGRNERRTDDAYTRLEYL